MGNRPPVVVVIGGSGANKVLSQANIEETLEQVGLEVRSVEEDHDGADRQFGDFVGPLTVAHLAGERKFIFLPRHGAQHEVSAPDLNHGANIGALAKHRTTHAIPISAVGTTCPEEVPVGVPTLLKDYVSPWIRASFFLGGPAVHVSMKPPVCREQNEVMLQLAEELNIPLPYNAVLGCIGGPQYGTAAEALFWKTVGANTVGQTLIPELKHLREAGIHASPIVLPTDVDTGSEDPADRTEVEVVIANLAEMIPKIMPVVLHTAARLLNSEEPLWEPCYCPQALANAVQSEGDLRGPHQRMINLLRQNPAS